MENTDKTIIDPLVDKINRRTLLPWWIKLFCWIFMLAGVLSFMNWLIALIIGDIPYVNLFSNRMNTTELFSPWGIFLGGLVLFKAYVGYALWFEKNNGVVMGRIDAALSILACIVAMGISMFTESMFQIRLEILLLVPYYLKLNSLEYEWKYMEKQI